MIKSKIIAALFVAALASPAVAATLDFTSSAINTPGGLSGSIAGTTYTISGKPNRLTNATHGNNVGCTGQGWDFACDSPTTGRYDVGFGISGNNNNEIDNNGEDASEYVQVSFNNLVKITGFAGMLAYGQDNGETVTLQYSGDSGRTFSSTSASAFFNMNNSGTSFDTVGLAFQQGLSLFADVVRFRAGAGRDDSTANVTAAGLEVSAVPVPAALPLLLVGMGAFGFVARRKKRSEL